MPAKEPWPALVVGLIYDDVAAAIAFLERAVGAETRARVDGPDGRVEHCELEVGDAVFMLNHPPADSSLARPRDGASAWLYVRVDDPVAHHARAVAAGADIISPPEPKAYGHEHYGLRDPEGRAWYFYRTLED